MFNLLFCQFIYHDIFRAVEKSDAHKKDSLKVYRKWLYKPYRASQEHFIDYYYLCFKRDILLANEGGDREHDEVSGING